MSRDRNQLNALITNLNTLLKYCEAYRDMGKKASKGSNYFMSANQSKDFAKVISDSIEVLQDQVDYWDAGSSRK